MLVQRAVVARVAVVDVETEVVATAKGKEGVASGAATTAAAGTDLELSLIHI